MINIKMLRPRKVCSGGLKSRLNIVNIINKITKIIFITIQDYEHNSGVPDVAWYIKKYSLTEISYYYRQYDVTTKNTD